MRACLQPMDFMQISTIASLHSIEAIEIRGVSRRSDCPAAEAFSRSLRYAAKILYELCFLGLSMLDKTVETRRPWRGSP